MPPRRGLLSTGRRAEPSASASRTGRHGAAAATAAAELPPYEPLSYPLNDAARRALAETTNNRDTKTYEKQLKSSAQFLRESVGAINDRLATRKDHVRQLEDRKDASEEKAAAYEATREIADRLEGEVADLTAKSEAALREVIDLQIELHDGNEVLAGLADEVQARQERAAAERRERQERQAERGEEGGDAETKNAEGGEEEPLPVTGAVELLQSDREAKAADYSKLSMYERYGLNNDYIAFKRTWHDAVNRDELPLPDATEWFDHSGRPAGAGKRAHPAAEDDGDDDDDDIVVEREVISYTCPLTLRPFKEPYSNKLCKHTFEKSAILGMIRQSGGSVQCPQTGCSQTLRASDFYFDEIILRKVKRAEQAQRRGVEDTSDVEPDEEADASMLVEGSRNVKAEPRGRGRPRKAVEDVDDE